MKIVHDCFDKKELAEVVVRLLTEKTVENTITLTKEPAVRVRGRKPQQRRRSSGSRNHRRRRRN